MGAWVEVNQGLFDFMTNGPSIQPGMLLDVAITDEPLLDWDLPKTERREVLVGHINNSNGGCGCCGGLPYGATLVRYKMVWGLSPDDTQSNGG